MKLKRTSQLIIGLILLCLIFASFILGSRYQIHKDRIRKESFSMNDPGVPISELKELALNHGDTDAYSTLDIAYLDLRHGEFLPIAEEMARKFDYPQAYYDVYFQLLKSTASTGTTLSLDSCDDDTRKKALKYLNLAYDKGHHQATEELGDLYLEGKFVQKDTVLGQKLLDQYDSIMGYGKYKQKRLPTQK